MAGPVPPYLATQTAAQSAFTVPFGLLTFVNSAMATAAAAGEFNVTVDCSLFVTEDVSNLRIYLDSLGYAVEFAKNTNEKSLNIDWGKFLDDATDATVVYQGTSPWIVAGTVTANQGDPGIAPWPVSISSFPGSLTVDQGTSPWVVTGTVTADQGTSPWVTSVSNFPAIQPVSQSGAWTTGRTWVLSSGTDSVSVGNFPATQPVSGTVTALQGTSPWVVSGSITTSPDVNIHDSAGNPLSSTGTALDVNVTDFPATVVVTQGTSPWVVSGSVAVTNFPAVQPVSGTVTALQGTSPWTVDGTVNAVQSGAWSVGRTWALTSGTDSISAVQSGTWTVQQGTPPWSVSVTNFPAIQPVSGTVTALQGTSPWTVDGTVNAAQSGVWTTGRTWALSSGTDSIAAVQSGTWTVQQGTPPWSVSQSGTWNINNISGIVSLPTGAATEATLLAAKIDLDKFTFTSTRLLVDGSGVTQPVSGTVTSNQGTSPWVVSGTVTANAGSGNFTVVQPTGTNLHTVLDSGTLTSITNALPAGTNVIGHVITDSGSTTTVTGNVTVVQPTGTNLHMVVDSGTVAATQSGTWTTGRTWTLASGTDSVAAVQSGTWTVQPGNTPNTAPWLVEQRAPGTLASYAAATLGLVATPTPTDIFTLYGSGTKTVNVTRVEISATENTAAIRDIVLIKRSATNTGGTSSAPTIVPYDSNNAAATATVLAYTANPASLGTSVGNIRTAKMDIPATNLVGNTDRIVWTFGDRPSQALVLRGTSQGLAVNLNGVTSASNSFDVSIEWTEV